MQEVFALSMNPQPTIQDRQMLLLAIPAVVRNRQPLIEGPSWRLIKYPTNSAINLLHSKGELDSFIGGHCAWKLPLGT